LNAAGGRPAFDSLCNAKPEWFIAIIVFRKVMAIAHSGCGGGVKAE